MKLPVSNNQATMRWLVAFLWTTVVITLLLMPGKFEIMQEPSFSKFSAVFFSHAWTKWDIIEVVVHVVIFIVLTGIWYWVLQIYRTDRAAMIIAIIIAVFLGTVTEVGQYFVNRGSLFIDLLANYFGIVIFMILGRQMIRF